jgi:Cdc6-like AAA superfamily ATPase
MAAMPDNARLSEALTAFFQPQRLRLRLTCPDEAEMYKVHDAFGGREAYWAKKVRGERFKATIDNGILFRPHIVRDLCKIINDALISSVEEGIMVKGLQGTGKSHSLVNTVLKLESTGEYLVTFIPNCESWTTAEDLVDYIFASFGTTAANVQMDYHEIPYMDKETRLKYLVTTIDSILAGLGKKWVFVFDQVNRLFALLQNQNAKDASRLTFPFHMISSDHLCHFSLCKQ